MEIAFVLFMSCVAFYLMVKCGISYSESSTHKYGKRLNNRINEILSAQRNSKESIEFVSKGKHFLVRVEHVKTGPGLQYETIPAYTCRNVYIDEELVCKMHQLDRLFGKAFLAEFSNKRNSYEISELIDQAYKEAKRINKEYWEKFMAKSLEKNSFYTGKAEK
jgi:hypothetical protein